MNVETVFTHEDWKQIRKSKAAQNHNKSNLIYESSEMKQQFWRLPEAAEDHYDNINSKAPIHTEELPQT